MSYDYCNYEIQPLPPRPVVPKRRYPQPPVEVKRRYVKKPKTEREKHYTDEGYIKPWSPPKDCVRATTLARKVHCPLWAVKDSVALKKLTPEYDTAGCMWIFKNTKYLKWYNTAMAAKRKRSNQ
jgi:hypothetical protein